MGVAKQVELNHYLYFQVFILFVMCACQASNPSLASADSWERNGFSLWSRCLNRSLFLYLKTFLRSKCHKKGCRN